MRQVQERAAASAAALSAGRARYDQAKRSWEECAVERQHLDAATALEMELGNVALERDQAIADAARLQADRGRLDADPAPGREGSPAWATAASASNWPTSGRT